MENSNLVKHLFQWMNKIKLIFKDFQQDNLDPQFSLWPQKCLQINLYQKNLIFIQLDLYIILWFMVKHLTKKIYKIFKMINFH